MAKRTISILALILTFLAATAAVAETWYIQTDNGKPLNIRSGPSKTSGIVATAENGIPLEVVELLEDGTWAKVVYHNQTGYCMTAFLTRARVLAHSAEFNLLSLTMPSSLPPMYLVTRSIWVTGTKSMSVPVAD